MARRRPPTRNNALADDVRKHTVRLFRFSTSLNGRVQQRLTGVRADLVRILAEGDPTEPTRAGDRINRVNAVSAEARRVVASRYRGINTATTNAMTELADVDQSIVARLIERTSGDRGITTLPARQLTRIVDRAIIAGSPGHGAAPAAEWWRRQAAGVVQRYQDQIREGMQKGESVSKLKDRIKGTAAKNYQDGIMLMPEHQAEALVRSAVMSVAHDMRMAEFKENADVIQGWTLLATFDDRTCETCMALSGASYDLDNKPLEGSPPLPTDGLPIHMQCRCTATPILVGEAPPEDLEFEDWLVEQPEAEQREILGEQWHAAWKSGELPSLSARITEQGRPINLKQLRGEKETEAA